ncbi:MAG: isochorismatase family cysteine hydrolase [Planctomycetota bacterium]|nr:isochorismatase family cysteine hydrolase [Planctomycetota bacterium]
MPRVHIDLLDDSEWPDAGFSFELPIQPKRAALIVVDVQRYATDTTGNLADTVRHQQPELQAGFAARAEQMIVNIQRLLSRFRSDARRVIYTCHGAQSQDGSDLILRRRGREHAAKQSTDGDSGHMPTKKDAGYAIDSRVAPQAGELVLDKNTSSAFHTTPIDLYLRNMGIETLVLTGVAADQCVLATAIDAADRGFHVILASDAVANLDPGSATATQILFGRVWGYVMTTDDILNWMTSGHPPQRTRHPATGLG